MTTTDARSTSIACPPESTGISLLRLLDDAASRWPDAIAVRDAEHAVTFADLDERSHRLGAALGRDAGVGSGHRVLVSLADGLDAVAAMWGVLRAGATFSILHADVRREPLRHALEDSGATLLLTDDVDKAKLARGLGVRADEPSSLDADPQPEAVKADPVAAFIYTSGSTALPKAVVCPHAAMIFAVEAIQSQLRYTVDDVVYCPLPLSFDYGLYQVLLGALSGATVWLGNPGASGPPLLRSVRESGATVLASVPSVATSLMRLLQRSGEVGALPRLRLITNTGAAMPPEVLAGLRASLPELRVQLMFGLTECKRATIMPPDGDLERRGSSGRALPGTKVLVVDDDDQPLAAGETGQIVIEGPHVMAGYWQRPEATRERFGEVGSGRLRTGDYGWLDEEGYLYFDGRRDDIYKERGFRVSANEVESATMRVPGVHAATVLPPSGERGAVLAVVASIGHDELQAGLEGELEAYKVPRQVHLLDRLPLNQNGKVDKAALAEVLHVG